MRVVGADDREACGAGAADRREVVGRLDLEAGPAALGVPRPRRVLDDLPVPEQQAAALIGEVLHGVRDDLVQNLFAYFHVDSLSPESGSQGREKKTTQAPVGF